MGFGGTPGFALVWARLVAVAAEELGRVAIAFIEPAAVFGFLLGRSTVGWSSSSGRSLPNHRMMASRPVRRVFFNSAVISPSMPQASATACQSMRPFRMGGVFRWMMRLMR